MLRIFFDTEFTGLIVAPKLISIGLIDETGEHTFYAELSDTWRWLDAFDKPVKLVTDSPAWNWPWIQEIFHELGAWPKNLDGQPLLLTMNDLKWVAAGGDIEGR